MGRTHLLTATVCAAGALGLALTGSAMAGAASKNPTPAQIRAAVAKAKTSSRLWATVNACDTQNQPSVIGIRAQMPALGFPARLSMLITIDYWDGAHKRFVPDPDPNAQSLVQLGVVSFGFEQGGKSFKFHPHAGLLRATVRFRWRRAGQLLLMQTRTTSAGHSKADNGDPPGHSAATCTIR